MKKLKLQALGLGAKETLTRSQLKNVLGGDGPLPTTTNPTCQGTTGTNWYCCKNDTVTHLQNQSCDTASGNCLGGTLYAILSTAIAFCKPI